MNKDLEAKIVAFIESRMGYLSVELKDEDAQLCIEADEAQVKLEAALSEEQKKLFIDFDLKSNLRDSAESELFYSLGFYEGIYFLNNIVKDEELK